MFSLALVAVLAGAPSELSVQNDMLRARVLGSSRGHGLELARLTGGSWTPVLRSAEGGIPASAWRSVTRGGSDRPRTLVFRGAWQGLRLTRTVTLPAKGDEAQIVVSISGPAVTQAVDRFALVAEGAKPRFVVSPSLIGAGPKVMADFTFRSPFVGIGQQGGAGALVRPDLGALRDGRPVPLAFTASKEAGTVGFGFLPSVPDEQGQFKAATVRWPIDGRAEFRYRVALVGQASRQRLLSEAADRFWREEGGRRVQWALPQTMHFAEVPRTCYDTSLEENLGGQPAWTEFDAGPHKAAAIPSGPGREEGWVHWGERHNAARSTYGMHAWGVNAKLPAWQERATKLLATWLSSPQTNGAFPTRFNVRKREWEAAEGAPERGYFDVAGMAWTGLWMNKLIADFPEIPRRNEIEARLTALTELLIMRQQGDGSWPTWLADDTQPVRDRGRRSTSAVVTWFLAERASQIGWETLQGAAIGGRDYLLSEIVEPGIFDDEATVQRGVEPDPATGQAPQGVVAMQAVAEAFAAIDRAQPDPKNRQALSQVLSELFVHQSVWRAPWIGKIHTFGGFGSGNWAPTWNAWPTAQIGETLLRLGAQYGEKSWFERGVAALRASTATLNLPSNEGNAVLFGANLPFRGLGFPGVGSKGTDRLDPREGFDAGEGSVLASLAGVWRRFGGFYTHVDRGWRVGIDGVGWQNGEITALMWMNRLPWTAPYRIAVTDSTGKREEGVLAALPRAVRSFRPQLRGDRLWVEAIPAFISMGEKIPQFSGRLFIEGRPSPVSLVADGLGAPAPRRTSGPLVVSGELKMDGRPLAMPTGRVWVDAQFGPLDWRLVGWTVTGDFDRLVTSPATLDTGASPLNPGARATGVLESPEFLILSPRITLQVGGSGQARVELIAGIENNVVLTARAGKGRVTWDVSAWRGQRGRLRIVDEDLDGSLRLSFDARER